MWFSIARCYLLLIVVFTGGCSNVPGPSQDWIRSQGGTVKGYEKERLERISKTMGECVERSLHVEVLASPAPTAYSFPNSRIFITRGLLDRLDDEEVTAVVAHELGHIIADRHVQSVVSLRGCDQDIDGEARADLLGRRLLQAVNIDPDSMIRMLTAIRESGQVPEACDRALAHRIELLNSRRVIEP